MRPVLINHDKVKEACQWCEENLGPENRRWWTTRSSQYHFDADGLLCFGMMFHFDVTEEEEINLTAFVLRWL